MPTLYTMGYKRKPLQTFVETLQQAGVDVVIDVRLRNTSHLAGYTKRDDLSYLLRKLVGMDYEHHPELAPTPELLDAYREDEDWAAYEARFAPLLVERNAAQVGREICGRYRAPCLLCSEPTAEHCHRRLIAEHWAAALPGWTVLHL